MANEGDVRYYFEEGRILTFILPTHDPTSDGTATVADSDPSYGLYRLDDNGPTRLKSGSMNQFDSGTITSQYEATIDVSTLSNWDQRDPLLFTVEATVSSVTNISHIILDLQEQKLKQTK